MLGASKSQLIAAALESEIRAGKVSRGDLLDSETALVRRFEVSRNTVRRGLEILAGKGLITTRTGIGSFVTYEGETIDDSSGWSLALSARGAQLQSRILDLSRGVMDLDCDEFPKGAECLRVDRLRFRVETGRGVSLEQSRVPWRDALEGVPATGLTDGSLNATLDAAGLTPVSGEEWANVLVSLPPETAEVLGREAGEPMLRLRRLTRTASGAVSEYVESILDPELFGLHVSFAR